jgi:hypothetical protein
MTMPDDELTAHEKQALVNHWLARGKPGLQFGNEDYCFNLQALLHCSDPILVERCRKRTLALRQLLARWNDNHTEVPNESETIEVRPGQPALRPGRPRPGLRPDKGED